MVDEKLFDDAMRLASLWLAHSKVDTAREYRNQVEASVQAIYHGLLAVRERIEKEAGAPAFLVSVGSRRDETIVLRDPFAG